LARARESARLYFVNLRFAQQALPLAFAGRPS
jgi:hypothetical protein